MKQFFLFTLCFILFCANLFSQNCPAGSITFATQSQVDNFPINYPNCTTINGDLIITSPSIINLSGLSQIETVSGDLNICNNPLLNSINGLSGVDIGGDFWLKNNDAITYIDASFNFGKGVYIEDNDALQDITNLTHPMSSATDLRIINNSNLFFCTYIPLSQSNASQFSDSFSDICGYLLEGNPSEIHDNAEGCNNAEQIIAYCTSAPVTLTYFQAKINNKTTLLTWETATESNNAGFEIQRSADGIDWVKTAWQDGQGTSTSTHIYTYRDENPLFGTSYYRLKQMDFDGAYEYTDIVQVNYKKGNISIYPNPVENTLHIGNITGEDIQEISIYNKTGREIRLQHTSNTIDVSALPSGMYIVKIGMKEGIFYEKFLIR